MKIYADILILENTIVNLFLLLLTMKCVRHKCETKRLIFSALLGGIYTIVMFIPQLQILTCLICKILVAYIMILIVYGHTTWMDIVKILSTYFAISFCLSGICLLIALRGNTYILGSSYQISNYSIKNTLLAIMLMYVACDRILNYIRDNIIVNNYIYLVEFMIDGIKIQSNGFLDTGNELREPITNLPCILIEKKLLESIDLNNKSLYYVPYNSIGYNGKLKGVKIKDIKINGRNICGKTIDAIICPCEQKLSKENEFNALLSRGVI